MKHAFRLSRAGAVAAAALAVLYSAITLAGAQANVATTPAPFVVQLTTTTIPPVPPASASPTPTPSPSPTPAGPLARHSHAADMDDSGRFVVIESNGDIATERTPHVRNAAGQITTRGRNNEDGNQEIFLLDYAQRRIFQITDTTHALTNTALSPIEPSNIDVQIVNLRPQLSRDARYLVFISNAYVDGTSLSPRQFVGQDNVAALRQDANTEIFLYEMPVPPPVDLTSGAEVPFADMGSGRMRRITETPASVPPSPGATGRAPTFARDNDAPAVSNNTQGTAAAGVVIAFQSRARAGNLGTGNSDGNADIFIFEDTNLDAAGQTFVQATRTTDVPVAGEPIPRLVFNNNPSLSSDGTRLAFISNADTQLPGPTAEAAAGQGNGEIYVASFTGSTFGGIRRVTTTTPNTAGGSLNSLTAGRRLSPNGNFVAFESFAVFGESGNVVDVSALAAGIYVYNVAANTFTEVVQRPAADQTQDIGVRWPTFTGDNSRVVWSSILNLRPDGTVAGQDDAAGLNPAITVNNALRRPTQIFSTPVGTRQVSRLTRLRGSFQPIQALPSSTIGRLAFSSTQELGDGNPDGLFEAFYLRIPRPGEAVGSSPTQSAVSFSTGATDRPVVAASPAPSPSPGVAVTGLAPGMLGIARSTAVTIGAGPRQVATGDAHETLRRPPLPVELANVSVSIDGTAAGLYSVAPNQINFVVPPGLASSATPLPVVIHNNGVLIHTTLLINPAQPDIFTSTNAAGGRAAALNVTNPCVSPPGEPFFDRTRRPVGATTGVCTSTQTEAVPTEIFFLVTGVRNATPAQVTVRIGSVDISGANILSVGRSLTPGFDQIVVRLPDSFEPAGDLPVVITVTVSSVAFTSRPADTAPRIQVTDGTQP